jgi:hypothetical protein
MSEFSNTPLEISGRRNGGFITTGISGFDFRKINTGIFDGIQYEDFENFFNIRTGRSQISFQNFKLNNWISGDTYINSGVGLVSKPNSFNQFFVRVDNIGTGLSGVNVGRIKIFDNTGILKNILITGKTEFAVGEWADTGLSNSLYSFSGTPEASDVFSGEEAFQFYSTADLGVSGIAMNQTSYFGNFGVLFNDYSTLNNISLFSTIPNDENFIVKTKESGIINFFCPASIDSVGAYDDCAQTISKTLWSFNDGSGYLELNSGIMFNEDGTFYSGSFYLNGTGFITNESGIIISKTLC